VRQGAVDASAQPRVVSVRGATALVSGDWAFGQLTGRAAMDEAVRLAGEHGVGMTAAVRCTHLGRLGEFVERAAERGCVGMVWLGGLNPVAAPYGGTQRALGTNPMAVGFPSTEPDPVVLDFATTVVAAGKIAAARAANRPLAPGLLVDPEGVPTTDPEVFYHGGALLPFGGHKGYALSVVIDLLGQALTGSDRPPAPSLPRDSTADQRRSGALFCAVGVGAFRPADEAKLTARDILNRMRDVPPALGFDRVLTPGQPEMLTRRERSTTGIDLAETTWRTIRETALNAGLSPRDLPEPIAAY
jgi:LDH2 family malate/lactate/ureidoglycolate dehydrogenase